MHGATRSLGSHDAPRCMKFLEADVEDAGNADDA